ncbi:hypothetical protein OIU78_022566 [Salix suchowensis]|nr:hypothetical protein OIU78_022566 [Salix suchowensis]
MGRSPCCENEHTNKGGWTKEEDERLINYIKSHGEGCWSRGIDPQTHSPLSSTTTTNNKDSNMGTKRITNFKLEEQNYSFVQVQPELITMSNIIKVGGSSDSAEDSNSSSGMTTELEVYPKHKLNLELYIGFPCQPQPSSINDLNDSKQANQQHQEQIVTHQSSATSATPFSSAPAVVHRTACCCTYNFKRSVTADSQYRSYRPLDA